MRNQTEKKVFEKRDDKGALLEKYGNYNEPSKFPGESPQLHSCIADLNAGLAGTHRVSAIVRQC
jgi:hypothetical protein